MEINTLIAKKLKEALDPVGQEDDDLDNDRKKNTKSDKYLKNRRKAISIAIENEDEDECEECGKSPCECENDDDDKNEDEDKSKNNKKSVKETYSNWREDLVEISNLVELNKKSSKINDTRVDNYKTKSINLSPELKESVEELGGILLETYEVDCEPQDIFEDFLDAEIYLLDDYTINYVVEDVICELLDEGYELDYIVDSINESVDHSLFVLNEATAADARLNARAANRAANRAAIRSQTTRLSRKTDRLSKIKTAAKNTAKAISYGTGYAAGAGVRAAKGAAKLAAKGAGYAAGASVRAAKGVGSQLAKGYEAGRKKNQSQSTQDSPQALSGSQTSASGRYRYVRQEPKQKNIAQRLGDSLRRLVARGARATARGARNLARAVDVKEDFILESIDIASQYFYEQGLNEYGVEILIDEIGEELFCEWVFDITNDSLLIERKLRTGETALPAKTREKITKKPVSRKNVSDLKGGSAAAKARSDEARRKARREVRQTPEPTERQQRLADLLAAQRKRNVENAKSKQPKTTSTPTKTKSGIASRIGSVLNYVGNRAREDSKKVARAAGTAAGVVHGAGIIAHRLGQEAGKSKTGKVIKKKLGISEEAESEQQQKLFGLALSVKRGQTPRSEVSAEVLKIVDSMSEKEIRKYAKTKHEGIPKKVQQEQVSPEDDSNEKNPEVESQTKKMKAAKINDLRTRLAAAMKGVY